jgi:hypothetical protein
VIAQYRQMSDLRIRHYGAYSRAGFHLPQTMPFRFTPGEQNDTVR